MGIQYFYNFCLTQVDDTDLNSDILTAVRKSYFSDFERIRDRITYDSEGISLLYDYCIERNKPLQWTVKRPGGAVVQEVLPSDNSKYYLCCYQEDKLFKRLLFSKFHTLLKVEYMDENGAVCRSLEPRKIQGGLCLLYKDNALEEPVALFAAPEVLEKPVREELTATFTDYTAIASTDEGVIWFLSDAQLSHYREFVDQVRTGVAQMIEKSYVDDAAPLYEKINAKDFNIKRNLSASLDIADAKPFITPAVPDVPIEDVMATDQSFSDIDDSSDQEVFDVPKTENPEDTPKDDPTDKAVKPDKQIMADGAVYSYFGELDDNDNRSGYGRTVTDLGRTAYEGEYRSDKRSGKGAYFYMDGTLCYSGDWSENVRHGVGVGISAKDGSMHIGKWVNNKPEGNGVRVAADGNVKFVCKELSDGTTALMNYLDNDTVVITKYDKSGARISEKIISLTNE